MRKRREDARALQSFRETDETEWASRWISHGSALECDASSHRFILAVTMFCEPQCCSRLLA
ncbi:MAG: hypothetical protein DME98_04625 [Verrucomicrobia bacterium]|nr:MAG: hypothetical protein DME98_04625 [Verrucomicrobiota bacterium]PYJ34540.1 MAG: hypothetical protein DME88_04760 [Verrucomicrobiota bacterium]